ncbi:hypothetical protein [Sphingobacterium sp. CZ-UAM]|nr:hypothetical protein [Sphingobacterium sp. CZ-UAM]
MDHERAVLAAEQIQLSGPGYPKKITFADLGKNGSWKNIRSGAVFV